MKMFRKTVGLMLAALFVFAAVAGMLIPNPTQAWQTSPRLQKFVWPLPVPPVAKPDKAKYPGVDYYKIVEREFMQKLHRDLPPTRLWGYGDATALSDPKGPVVMGHLGGIIFAQRKTPVRISFFNQLPARNLYPVDTSIMGATIYAGQNRTSVHLHGGFIPWVSDGGPHNWFGSDGTFGLSRLKWLPDENSKLTDDNWYPNDQSTRLLWYHDHGHDITRQNAYAGLATLYVIRDAIEEAMIPNGLPDFIERKGKNETFLVFQDKVFNADGSEWYPGQYDPSRWPVVAGKTPPKISAVPESFGDTMLVNGIVYPYKQVEARLQRVRILNACNSRVTRIRLYYALNGSPTEPDLASPGPGFFVIGNEAGFLAQGVYLSQLTLAPAERVDLLVDFSQVPPGKNLILYNDAPAPFPGGDDRNDFFTNNPKNLLSGPAGFGPNTRTILQFRVIPKTSNDKPFNLALPPLDPKPLVPVSLNPTAIPLSARVRNITLNEDPDSLGRLEQTIGTDVRLTPSAVNFGRPYTSAPTEVVNAGSTEAWVIINRTGDTHPLHLHLVNFQVLYRQPYDVVNYNGGVPVVLGNARGPDPTELGWKETVKCNPGEITVFLVKFDLPLDPVVNGFIVPVPDSPRTGKKEYVYHCHILEHEEHDMMRPLIVAP